MNPSAAVRRNGATRAILLLHDHRHMLLIAAGVGIMLWGMVYYLSPLTRLSLNGVRLTHRVGQHGPVMYLVGIQTTAKSWAEHQGTLDTPLGNRSGSETGTVTIELARGPEMSRMLKVRANEWIKTFQTTDGTVNQLIPANHPSLAPGTVLLDVQGTLLERQSGTSNRLGRAMNFLIPRFPKGTQRPGSSWTEHVEWNDMVDEWMIHWDGDLKWQLKDNEACYQTTCVRLAYQATLTPTLLQPPLWAKGMTSGISFDGKADGEALYNTGDKLLISNTFNYDGRLSIPISNLESIPMDRRVGDPLSSEPGTVVLQFSNQTDVRKPN